MKRLKAIEKKGYKVSILISGTGAIATKGNRVIKGTSVTNLYKKIFSYE